MDDYRFVAGRVVGFPQESRVVLRSVARRLLPHEREIVERWTARQWQVWQPPGFERVDIERLFGRLLRVMLESMAAGEPERCLPRLEETGVMLAKQGFPFEALMLSIHFLEETYAPFLLRPRTRHLRTWLTRLDEFLHVVIAALATSYFRFRRDELTASAEVGWIIQEGLAPEIPPRAGGLEVGHAYISAAERARLGGDFMEVFEVSRAQVAFAVGDLSGHGLEAVAGAVTIRSLFRGLMRERPDVADVVTRLNRILFAELDPEQYASLLAGVFTAEGRVALVNAGAPPPIHCSGGCSLLEQVSLPLAVRSDATYAPREVALHPGDLLVAYTDGLIEARAGGELLGEERVLAAVSDVRDAPARTIAEHLLEAALTYAGGQLTDDITVLVIRRLDLTAD